MFDRQPFTLIAIGQVWLGLASFPCNSLAQTQAGTSEGEPIFGDDSNEWAMDSECDDPRFVGIGMASYTDSINIGHDATDCEQLWRDEKIWLLNNYTGTLTASDPTHGSIGFAHFYRFQGDRDSFFLIDLKSPDFDTYLILRNAETQSVVAENDDYEGDVRHSFLEVRLENSNYELIVAGYSTSDIGGYTLSVRKAFDVELQEMESRNYGE